MPRNVTGPRWRVRRRAARRPGPPLVHPDRPWVVILTLVFGAVGAVGVLLSWAFGSGAGSGVSRSSDAPVEGSPALRCPDGTTGGGPTGAGAVGVALRLSLRGDCIWSAERSPVKPRSTVTYLLTYRNGSRSIQRDVTASVHLGQGATIVPKTSYLYNSNHPDGLDLSTDAVVANGIVIGAYMPEAVAYVRFDVVLPAIGLRCGLNDFVAEGTVRTGTMTASSDLAHAKIFRAC